jgi:hypothetical protein
MTTLTRTQQAALNAIASGRSISQLLTDGHSRRDLMFLHCHNLANLTEVLSGKRGAVLN